MKSEPSGIVVVLNGTAESSVMKTPPSTTGWVYCKRCDRFAAADALLYPSKCDHEWESAQPPGKGA